MANEVVLVLPGDDLLVEVGVPISFYEGQVSDGQVIGDVSSTNEYIGEVASVVIGAAEDTQVYEGAVLLQIEGEVL